MKKIKFTGARRPRYGPWTPEAVWTSSSPKSKPRHRNRSWDDGETIGYLEPRVSEIQGDCLGI